jgi:hypothetical protein
MPIRTTNAANPTHENTSAEIMEPAYASRGHNWTPTDQNGGPEMAHAKDKGDKQVKKTAQKSIKEKRAAKKAKKQSSSSRSE